MKGDGGIVARDCSFPSGLKYVFGDNPAGRKRSWESASSQGATYPAVSPHVLNLRSGGSLGWLS